MFNRVQLSGLTFIFGTFLANCAGDSYRPGPYDGIKAIESFQKSFPEYTLEKVRERVVAADEYIIVIYFTPQPHLYTATIGWNANDSSNYEIRSSKSERKIYCQTRAKTLDLRLPYDSKVFDREPVDAEGHAYYTVVEIKRRNTKTISFNFWPYDGFEDIRLIEGFVHDSMLTNCKDFEVSKFSRNGP